MIQVIVFDGFSTNNLKLCNDFLASNDYKEIISVNPCYNAKLGGVIYVVVYEAT